MAILVFLTGICHHAGAQHKPAVDYFFLTDTVFTQYGKTFANKLEVVNHTSSEIILFKNVAHTEQALIAVPDTIKLPAGSTQRYPVKYMSAALQTYKVSLRTAEKITLPDSAVFHTKMNDPYRVRINVLEPDVYLDSQTGKVSFRLRCLNDGYLPVRIRLLLSSYPEGLTFEKQTEIIELPAGSQQIITLNARNVLKGHAPDFTVNLEAADPTGKTLATTSLRVFSLSSVKRLATGYDQYANLLNNSVELSYVNLNRDFSFLQLRGRGNVLSSEGADLTYNLNLNYYTAQHAMDAYDTWVAYSNKYVGVTAGNITENLDYPLFGRGVKASAFLNEEHGFDLYYVNNSYLLFSGLQSSLRKNTNTYAASYRYGKAEAENGRISYIHSRDPWTRVKTNLVNGEATLIASEHERLNLSAGYSYENSADTSASKAGYALGGTYAIQKNQWDLSLNNYFSTGYYSGLRRGVIQMEERIRYSLNPLTGIYARFSWLKNAPNYLSQTRSMLNNSNQITIYEMGFSHRKNAFSATLYPYLLSQDLHDNYLTREKLHSFSTRLALDLNYTFGTSFLSLNSDYGYTKSNNPLVEQHYNSFKINASYAARNWGVSARMQTAPYYLQEELIPVANKKYRQYSIGPNVHFSALDQRMEISVAGYANYNNYGYGWMNSIDAQVRYKVAKTWRFSGQVFYNTYTGLRNSASTQFRIGIQKSFVSANAPGLKKLELSFFGDDNGNGLLDDGERRLEGIIVDVSGTVAASNQKGKVTYSNLAKGEKLIQVKDGKGWSQFEPLKLLLQNNQNMEIPLVKSGRLTGSIVPVAQKYVVEEPMLEGIRVTATDDFNRTFFALTDETGNFYFSIPVGSYGIHIETAGQFFTIKDARKEITIKERNNEPIVFEWLDERRKIEMKRF